MHELLGKNIGKININTFPSYLKYLCNNINYNYEPDYFINNHSLFPLYRPFLQSKRIDKLKNDMINGNAVSIYMRIGEMAGGICKSDIPKVCLDCLNEDYEKYGEKYFHTMHQVPGNKMCGVHNKMLYQVKYDEKDNYLDIYDINGNNVQYIEIYIDKNLLFQFRNLANDIQFIFKLSNESMNLENTILKYESMLSRKGYITARGILKSEQLENDIINFYGKDFLKILESDIDENISWVKWVAKASKVTHPIRHILFIRFLFGSFKNFYEYEDIGYHPFNLGPWPCLNPMCQHYKKDVISNYMISSRSKPGIPLGIFKCDLCNYTYTRLGPDKEENDKFIKRTVKEYGDVWKEELRRNILKQIYNISGLASVMECDRKTIGKYAKQLGVFDYLNSRMKTEEIGTYKIRRKDNLKNNYKKHIIEYINNNPNANRSNVYSNLMKEYTWLYRYDRQFLESILPKAINRKQCLRKNINRINWEEKDAKLLNCIYDILQDIKQYKVIDRPRLTISYFSKKVNYPLIKCLDKIPRTKKLVEENQETIRDYHIKRVDFAIELLNCENKVLKKSKILKYANLRDRKYVDEYIDNILCNSENK